MQPFTFKIFKEWPKTSLAWWAFGLGIGTLFVFPFLGIFGAVISPFISLVFGELVSQVIGFMIGFGVLGVSISAVLVGIRAYRKGERSWVLWVGLLPALLVAAGWVFMVIGEFAVPH